MKYLMYFWSIWINRTFYWKYSQTPKLKQTEQ